ncbi:MAG TPA: hypothetical protein VI409_08450, partial [Gaiellaceae bacterium]|nr:hypothetical protein [Gaiellaceae bacterium]
MNEADKPWQSLAQHRRALLGIGEIDQLGFLDQRTDPIGARPARQRSLKPRNHFLDALLLHEHGLHRLAARRLAIKLGDIHIAIERERERARNGRCRHHQKVRGLTALGGERQTLMNAEAMLLVDHHKGEVFEGNVLLDHRMRADDDVDLATRNRSEHVLARLAFVAAGQHRDAQARLCRKRRDRRLMLARENL